MSSAGKLQLSGPSSSMAIIEDIENINGTFNTACNGSSSSYWEQCIWIIYKVPSYMPDIYYDPQVSQIVFPGGTNTMQSGIQSARFFNYTVGSPLAILFEHAHYCGKGKSYSSSVSDLNNDFPKYSDQGVSGFIVISGVWSLYASSNYGGDPLSIYGNTEVGPGTFWSFVGGTANDRALSLKLVRSS